MIPLCRHIPFIVAIAFLLNTVAQANTRDGYPIFQFTDRPVVIDEQDTLSYSTLGALLYGLHERARSEVRTRLEVARFDIHTYTYGTSHCLQDGFPAKLLSRHLPFQTNTDRDIAVEGFSKIDYQWPGLMQISNLMLKTNQRRKGRKIMAEAYEAILPIYSISRLGEYDDKRSYVMPFYDIGLSHYRFSFSENTDSLVHLAEETGISVNRDNVCTIHFEPIHSHHTLLSGDALVDSTNYQVISFCFKGRMDFAKFSGRFQFTSNDQEDDILTLHDSDIEIDYHILKARAQNRFHTRYKYIESTPLDSIDRKTLPLDLTFYYQPSPQLADDIETLRPTALPHEVDSLLYGKTTHPTLNTKRRQNTRIETLGETLIGGTRFGNDDNLLRIYSPIDPASIGYDKLNGLTIFEKARYRGRYLNGQQLNARGELGYCFGPKEWRYKAYGEWIYLPRRRGKLRIESSKRNSGFSSKFINTINEALTHKTINFDSLGLEYFRRYEVDIQHSIELTNGLMFYLGVQGTYRDPVRHGVRKWTEQQRNELIKNHYSDLAPYLRLEWTPRQYHWYNNGYKEYISSPSPTFSLELAKAIPGAFNTNSKYGRIEFDANQSFNLDRTRIFAYRVGMGKFFNQSGEYFINYRYFSRSMYPQSWTDDRIGGTFHLLDDYWYSSTSNYLQMHVMHETPFGLCHMLRPLSPFIIKERLYLGSLFATGKPIYNELGYGIDNNYFNLGGFIGFKGLDFYSIGVKFRIEIGRHI